MSIISQNIYGDLRKTGTPTETVYKALGFKSPDTFYRRMKDPGTFTAREIRILRRYVSQETADMITR